MPLDGDLTSTISSGADEYGVPPTCRSGAAADLSDQVYDNTLYGGSSPRADVTGSTTGGDFDYGRPNGTLDSDDSTYWSGLSAQPAMGRKKLSSYSNAADLRNRKGLAGYEWDPAVKKYHVRNRVLDPEIGRWTRRDPLGYVDGTGLYAYPMGMAAIDPMGLTCISASDCGRNDITPWVPGDGSWPPDGATCVATTSSYEECVDCCRQYSPEPGRSGRPSKDCLKSCDWLFNPGVDLPGSPDRPCGAVRDGATDDECCDAAQACLRDMGAAASVFCCDGRQVICLADDHGGAPGSPGRDPIRICSENHEKCHARRTPLDCSDTDGQLVALGGSRGHLREGKSVHAPTLSGGAYGTHDTSAPPRRVATQCNRESTGHVICWSSIVRMLQLIAGAEADGDCDALFLHVVRIIVCHHTNAGLCGTCFEG
ncbi:MAG: hypothetical protein H6811_05440 [Phycisphaeraceae bacterium]|nr:hypothetical protein [Phycisphaeraceae bacterium]